VGQHALRPLPLLEGIALPEPLAVRAPVRPRGHGLKIAEAVRALQAARQLPPNLRPKERHDRICAWLTGAGYQERELPSRWAVSRYLNTLKNRTDELSRLRN
jgi:hypothetical protein